MITDVLVDEVSQMNTGFTNWAVGTFSGILSGTSCNDAYFFCQGNRPQNADLVSQVFDFTGYTGIALEFKHRYTHNRSTGNPATFSHRHGHRGRFERIESWEHPFYR